MCCSAISSSLRNVFKIRDETSLDSGLISATNKRVTGTAQFMRKVIKDNLLPSGRQQTILHL